MLLKLNKIILNNFKKITDLELDFTQPHTIIAGPNGIGKTTIKDAFLWVVIDKDSTGRKVFEIKTRDENGNTNKDLEYTVTLVLQIDENPAFTLKKVYKEKWGKVRGNDTAEFKGNETLYFWDETPLKKEDFENRLTTIGNADTFKTLADLKHFNSLSWQDRRKYIMNFVTIPEVKPDKSLTPKLKNKTPEDLQSEIKFNKKKLIKEIDETPVRIEEIKKGIVELPYTENEFKDQLAELETPTGSATTNKVDEHNKRKHEIVEKIANIILELKNKYRELGNKPLVRLNEINNEINMLVSVKDTLIRQSKNIDKEVDELEKMIITTRNQYLSETAKTFDGKVCPTCNREYDVEKIKSAESDFNKMKSETLETLIHKGKSLVAQKEQLQATQKDILNKITHQEQQEVKLINERLGLNVDTLKKSLNEQYLKEVNEHPELIKLNEETKKIDEKIEKLHGTSTVVPNEQQQKRDLVLQGLEKWKVNNEHQTRINELQEKLKQNGIALNDLEKTEHELNNFIKKRIALIETALSKEFEGVQFKMFEQQVNGEITETCTILKNGVPYTDLNTASQVEVSLKIINTLSKKSDKYIPLFIDNRESVTNIPSMVCQTISLMVAPELNEIKVFNNLAELDAYVHELKILNNTSKTENNVRTKTTPKKGTNKGGNSAK